jgi:hypothetical protein
MDIIATFLVIHNFHPLEPPRHVKVDIRPCQEETREILPLVATGTV